MSLFHVPETQDCFLGRSARAANTPACSAPSRNPLGLLLSGTSALERFLLPPSLPLAGDGRRFWNPLSFAPATAPLPRHHVLLHSPLPFF